MKKLFILLFVSGWLMACDTDEVGDTFYTIIPQYTTLDKESGGEVDILSSEICVASWIQYADGQVTEAVFQDSFYPSFDRTFPETVYSCDAYEVVQLDYHNYRVTIRPSEDPYRLSVSTISFDRGYAPTSFFITVE